MNIGQRMRGINMDRYEILQRLEEYWTKYLAETGEVGDVEGAMEYYSTLATDELATELEDLESRRLAIS